jgi:hypothetical protein
VIRAVVCGDVNQYWFTFGLDNRYDDP